ncbi:hypothetical protein TREMEDRAFT_40566 [Tremella mesenterica DSM 1558]|uniref:uncharacterized protein n=1 Tax=Tremella mesenterica (strain ATCC 24925 / CBS 8224 / DSM 1558 / NBRC 9311 / NRRL Y-6157 / RJB 2259-6 / UBC 559-6) TaxID=578456 RepID=UPI0003F48D9E|nr:uncharacterized protein TREMEDRAFT_40566 [Tremella mesenterica DSM 1558]EIW66879.1 hypothetical protein TREMEDRAFT_40566 [Tremella mesenterica DSM 1558]
MPLSDEEDRAQALLALSVALLDSALDLFMQHSISDAQLNQPSVLMPGGTVGKHLRHVIETFQAFLLPLIHPESHAQSSEINYDTTLPSSRKTLARSADACQAALRAVRDDLEAWGRSSDNLGQVGDSEHGIPGVGVAGETNVSGLAAQMQREVRLIALTPTRQEIKSTFGRELWFCALHAIHHFSMLRTIAVHELSMDLPLEFGTAPSTLLYRGPGWTPPTSTLPKTTTNPFPRAKL